MDNKILAIDIGSSKICVAIAEVRNEEPKIIGFGTQKSQGIKKGTIVNIELASQAIRNALIDAKRMADAENITKAIVSISSSYTKSLDSSGVVSIANGGEITIKEISRALETALYNSTIPTECEVIHILPYKFKLDDQDFIEDPDGMTGSRLEVFTHIITAKKAILENLKKVVRLAGVEVENIVLSPYASSIATLLEDEKELGVACIDMGGSTCETMIYLGSSMRYNHFLGVGSQHITSDIAEAIHTSISAAEEIKIKYADPKYDENDEMSGKSLEVPSMGTTKKHHVSLAAIQKVVSMRVVETFNILSQAIKRSGLEDQIGTLVLTGGMSKMTNILKIAEVFFRIPIRIAKPIAIDSVLPEALQDESNATIIGLILYGMGKHTNYERDSQKNIRYKKCRDIHNSELSRNDEISHTDLRNLGGNFKKSEESVEKIDIIVAQNQKDDSKVLQFIKKIANKIF